MDTIKLSHGSGRGLNELLHAVVLPALGAGESGPLEDGAVLPAEKERLVFTTDSFVVHPLAFNGGNIGKLAACGTINDLVMMGAVPKYISVSLILEEGLDPKLLSRALLSLKEECEKASVKIVCGDTKVVDHGKADGMFINTTGIGLLPDGCDISAANAKPGDTVLVSGPIGQHGIAILAARQNLSFASSVVSDCASLHEIVRQLLSKVPAVRVLRDATRGGAAAVLNEIAASSNISILLKEESIPVSEAVKGACSYLGMDPLHIANEGRFVAVVPNENVEEALAILRQHPLGQGAAVVGEVKEKDRFPVILETVLGATRMVEVPPGELLPRIC